MQRKEFIKLTTLGSIAMITNNLKSFANEAKSWPDLDFTMPVLFIGHGSPMNAIEDNEFSRGWKNVAASIPKPKAIVCISAHWLTNGTKVTAMQSPKTIHDFGGFPNELFQVSYPSPGSPEIAEEIKNKITTIKTELDYEWGLDHGTWSVLVKMYPKADIPVIQLSIDYSKPGQYHYDLAKELSFLRKKGVLILSSGNIVHNLRVLDLTPNIAPYDWAISFDEKAKKLMLEGNHKALIEYQKLGQDAMLSIPTPDHYYPLMYTLGLQNTTDKISFPIEGYAFRSGSMRSILLQQA